MVQILQLVPSSQGDQFSAWVVVEGIMLKIPVTVPRVFYINSKAPIEKLFEKISEEKPQGKNVNKTLPHGRRAYNLYEVLLVLLFSSCNAVLNLLLSERHLRFNIHISFFPDCE